MTKLYFVIYHHKKGSNNNKSNSLIFYLKLFLPKFTCFLFFATAHGKRTERWTLLSRVDHFYIPLQKGVSFMVYFRHILHAVPVRNALSKLFWSFSLSKILKFECCLEGGSCLRIALNLLEVNFSGNTKLLNA